MLGLGLDISPQAVRAARGTPAPSLDMDFMTGAQPGAVTFTRASAAWGFNSGGALTSYGTNTPVFDYRVTASATNLALQSQNFASASWTKANASVTSAATTAPDGTSTGDLVTGTAPTVHASQSVAVASGARVVFSVHARAGASDWLRLRVQGGAEVASVWFNLGTGALGAGGGSTANIVLSGPTATDAGGGWWRCGAVYQTTGFTSLTLGAGPAASDGVGGVSGNSVSLWGAQVEETAGGVGAYAATTTTSATRNTTVAQGLRVEEARTNLFLNSAVGVSQDVTVTAAVHTLSFYGTGTVTLSGVSTAGPLVGTSSFGRVSLTFTPTAGSLTLTVSGNVTNVNLEVGAFASSPILTTASSVTRAADVVLISPLSPWFNAVEGAVVAEFSFSGVGTGTQSVWTIDDATTTERYSVRAASGTLSQIVTDGAATQAALGSVAMVAGAVVKSALSYAANDFAGSINGGAAATDTAGTLPTVTRMTLGNRVGGEYLNGYFRRLRVFRQRLPAATLQSLTA